MIKLLSLLLSFTLIFSSVAPSMAQVVADKQNQPSRAELAESLENLLSKEMPVSTLLQPVEMTKENSSLFAAPYKANANDTLYLAEITRLVDTLTAFSQNQDNQDEPKEPTLAEFEQDFRAANTPALKKALASTPDPELQALIKKEWESWIKAHVKEAYEAYLKEYKALVEQSEKTFKARLKELANQALASQFTSQRILALRRTDVNDPTVYKTIDPISQFLPLMQGAFGEEVVSKQTREKAAQALQARVQKWEKACQAQQENACQRLLEESHALALFATTHNQLQTVADVLLDFAAVDGTMSPAFINTLGADLLAVDDLDKDYSKLFYVLSHVVDKAEKPTFQEMSILSAITWVDLARELSSQQRKFSRPLYNAGFYSDPKEKVQNKYSAWVDLGLLIGRLSQQNATLRNVMNGWLDQHEIVSFRGKGQTSTRFNLLLTGLLAGGFQVDIKGTSTPIQEMYQDVSGKVHTRTVAPTAPLVAPMRAWLAEKGLTQSEWLAFYLYNMGGMELDPATVRYLRNFLASSVKDKTKAAQLGMEVSKHPTVAEVEAYKTYETALTAAGIVDIINRFLLDCVLITFVFKGVGAAARFGATYARAVQLLTAASRSGKAWTAISKAGRLSRIASKLTFGAQTPMQAFIKAARANQTYPHLFADASKLAKAAQAAKVATPAAGALTTIELDGTLRMVPEGFKYVQISSKGTTQFVLIRNTPEALAQAARAYGVEVSAITDAVAGSFSKAAPQMARLYTTTGAAGTHTGATGVVQNLTRETATQAAETVTEQVAPRAAAWGETTATNALGQSVKTWKPLLLETPQLAPAAGSLAPRALSWGDKFRLWWELDVKPLLKFGTSRYGAASLTTGAMPLTAERAVMGAQQWGQGVEVVERIRTAQRGVMSMDEIFSGAGASYRVAMANRGGIAAQQAAARTAQTLQGVSAAGYAAPVASLGAWLEEYSKFVGVPARGESLAAFLAEQDRVGYNSAQWARAAGYLIPPFWQKWSLFQSAEQSANVLAATTLSQQYPLATALVQILQSEASDRNKKAAILKLYHRGKLTTVLAALQTTNPEAYNRLVQLRSTENWEAFGSALYDLYRLGIIENGVNGLKDVESQESLLAELGYLIEDEDFQHQAGVLYRNDVKIVPSSQQTFQGDVPTVPQADQQKIADTFRTEETIEVAAGKDTGAYTHYEGNIPFYYRRADGTITDKPVGVLSQNKAGWYNTLLSYMPIALERDPYLNNRRIMWAADRSGMDIPKGFVLALDEQGQWKFVMPTGNRAMVESIPTSQALLNQIQQKGSVRAAVDTPYTSTDLLAMARMMEHHPDLRLQLTLNPPSSLRPWLKLFGGYIGLDAAASLTGPFKEGVKGIKTIPTGALSNGVSGAGYLSPWIGGVAMKWMTKFGYVPSILGLSAISFAGLLYSFFGLGLDGRAVNELDNMPTGELLTALSMPMLLLVITASLFGALVPVILNIFKDPTTRTSANLQFATTKQYSRLFLTLASFGLAYKPIMNFVGVAPLDWTIVVPAALGLLSFASALFVNTPMFRNWWSDVRGKKSATAAATAAEETVKERKATAEEQKEFARLYNEEFVTSPGVRGMKSRVRGVYWAYAASLMMIGQLSSALLKDPVSGVNYGQLLIAGFMYATAKMRSTASRQVDQKVRTDDQFTGMSIPLLAVTSGLLAFMPYSISWMGALTALVAMLHYVGTAVPGQLDSTRIQNMVSSTMQKKKQDVLDNTALSDAEKKEKVSVLGLMEKDWASRASATYSYANGFGLLGVGGAALLAGIFMDKWAPDSVINSLDTIATWMGHSGEAHGFTMDRLVFLISTGLLARLTYRNWDMTKDFLGSLFKKKVTQANIDAGVINAGTFGVTSKNAEAQLAAANKELGKMKDKFFSYGVVSEKKMTDLYNQMSKLYNRLVAIHAVLGMTPEVKAAFEKLMGYGRSYQTIVQNNHLSEMLQREFAHMAQMMSVDGALQKVAEKPQYVEQGLYQMPQAYQKFEDAAQLINEMDLMAHHIISGQSVSANMYALFIEYYNRVTEQLQEYRRTNVADSKRTALLFKRMNSICKQLKIADDADNVLMSHKGPTSLKDVQALRDMLTGFLVAHPEDEFFQDSFATGAETSGKENRNVNPFAGKKKLGNPLPAHP